MRPSWRDERGQVALPDGQQGSGGVERPSWMAEEGREALAGDWEGLETRPEDQGWSGGTAECGRLFWRFGSGREAFAADRE